MPERQYWTFLWILNAKRWCMFHINAAWKWAHHPVYRINLNHEFLHFSALSISHSRTYLLIWDMINCEVCLHASINDRRTFRTFSRSSGQSFDWPMCISKSLNKATWLFISTMSCKMEREKRIIHLLLNRDEIPNWMGWRFDEFRKMTELYFDVSTSLPSCSVMYMQTLGRKLLSGETRTCAFATLVVWSVCTRSGFCFRRQKVAVVSCKSTHTKHKLSFQLLACNWHFLVEFI